MRPVEIEASFAELSAPVVTVMRRAQGEAERLQIANVPLPEENGV